MTVFTFWHINLKSYYYINIIGLLIGFRNSFETVTEGEAKDVCAEVKFKGSLVGTDKAVRLSIKIHLGKYRLQHASAST